MKDDLDSLRYDLEREIQRLDWAIEALRKELRSVAYTMSAHLNGGVE